MINPASGQGMTALHPCRMIAIEGTHGVGKTATAHALAAELRLRGASVELVPDMARESKLVEDASLRGIPRSILTELHLCTQTLASQIIAARSSDYIICDKTAVNYVAYAEVLFSDYTASRYIAALRELLSIWVPNYSKVFFLSDRYDLSSAADAIRNSLSSVQDEIELVLRNELVRLRASVVEVPQNFQLNERIVWMMGQVPYEAPLAGEVTRRARNTSA